MLAIAITEILATWGRMIRLRDRVRAYWVHVGWMVLMLLFAFQNWFSLWQLRDSPSPSFFPYVLSLTPALTLVVFTFVLCPGLESGRDEDLEQYYYRNSTWIFGVLAIYAVTLILNGIFLRREPWLGVGNVLRIVGLAVVLFLAMTKNRTVHGAALAICFGLLVTFVLFR